MEHFVLCPESVALHEAAITGESAAPTAEAASRPTGRWYGLACAGRPDRHVWIADAWLDRAVARVFERFAQARRLGDSAWVRSGIIEAELVAMVPMDDAGAYDIAEKLGIIEGWRSPWSAVVLP